MINWVELVYQMAMEIVDIHLIMVILDFLKIFLIVHFISTIHLIYSNNSCLISAWTMISVCLIIFIRRLKSMCIPISHLLLSTRFFRQMDTSCFSFWWERENETQIFIYFYFKNLPEWCLNCAWDEWLMSMENYQ
jgi:hypothetical protein